MHAPRPSPLRILHVLRAPVGGLFRHHCDLARGQAARGHAVGVIADSTSGGEQAETALAELAPQLALGLRRLPIAREIGLNDGLALLRIANWVRGLAPDVLHGHGAKGGALARLMPADRATIRAYTPHGGALHYRPDTLRGALYGRLERLLMRRTDLFLFESAYARDLYAATIGSPRATVRVVHNGVAAEDFVDVLPAVDATDLVFVGELRRLKGVDLLLEAVAALRRAGRPVTLTIVGAGPDAGAFEALAHRLGLANAVRFAGFRPARQGFALGRLLVVPSRGESLPYVVLEAAAAGVPIIATRVGGIPEIFAAEADRLVAPDDVAALSAAIAAALDTPGALAAATQRLRGRVRETFSVAAMVAGVLDGYHAALAARILRSR
jgi:glycosyltransferase involved in cell wall biosynthesis